MNEFSLYFDLGRSHILDPKGYDHILFVAVLCGVYLLKDWKKVLILVTAFTIGHSLTLALNVYGKIGISLALIEFLIPLTIVITASINILRKKFTPTNARFTYGLALFFGLIHGIGFSSYLRALLGKESGIITPLFAFNVGLEIGQLLIVITVLLLSFLLGKFFKVKYRDWKLFLSSAIWGIALLMAIERLQILLH